jgi:FemAB-related protein (PEP-CTERM system-associated)
MIMEIQIAPSDTADAPQVVEWNDGTAWDRFVDAASDGTIGHRWAWRDVVERSYGLTTHMLASVDRGRLRGVLPLVVHRSRLFGRHVVSMPFLDVGGLCTDGDDAIAWDLLKAAEAIADAEQAVLELRHLSDRPLNLPRTTEKVTMRMPLGTDPDELFASLPSNRRGQVRKARRAGLQTSFHGPEAVGDFYKVLAENMRDLGSPVHKRSFFEELATGLGDRCEVIVVREGEMGRVLGAGIVLYDRGLAVVPWSSSLREAFKLAPNQLMYWEAMQRAIGRGTDTFDFGRSSVGSGTYVSKREWGTEPVQLYWDYYPENGEPPGEEVASKSWAVDIWRKLPLPVATAVGSRIRKGIPA